MKKLLVVFSLSLLVGALALSFVGKDSGYVLIVIRQTSIEMSLWMAVLIMLLVLAMLAVLAHLFYRSGFWLSRRKWTKLQNQTSKGLVEYLEGRWAQAAKTFAKAKPAIEVAFVNDLMAARASSEAGQAEQVESYLKQAEEKAPQNHLAVGLTRAQLHVQHQQFEQALAVLTRLKSQAPANTVVMSLLNQVYTELGDWEQLKSLLPDLRKYRVLDKEQLEQLDREINKQLLLEAVSGAGKGEIPLEKLQQTWDKLPAAAKKSRTLSLQYANGLIAFGKEATAEQVLRTTLKRNWSDELVVLYGRICGEDVKRQLLAAEGWLKERPGSSALLLALARLALRNQEWDKARQYYENCLLQGDNQQASFELGRLLIAQGEVEKGKRLLDSGFSQSHTLLDLPLPA